MLLSLVLLTGCLDKYSDGDDPVPTALPPVEVGPSGGTFEFDGATVEVPEGAVGETIELRFYETGDDAPEGFEGLSRIWVAEPEGFVFAEPVRVTIPFAGGDRPAFYWEDGTYGRIADATVSGDRMTAAITTFSSGFVAQIATEVVEEPAPFPPADVLFVIDNSCSMYEEQQALSVAMPEVLPTLDAVGIEYHLGVVSTDMSDTTNHAGKLQVANGVSFIDPATPDPDATFTQMAMMGTDGDFEEKGRAAAYTMVEVKPDIPRNAGFYRPEATLSIIFVSDEEDQSGQTPINAADFRTWMDTKKGRPEDVLAHGFVTPPNVSCAGGDTPGAQYAAAINHTGGVLASICEADWEPFLTDMFDRLRDTARVQLPEVPGEIVEVALVGPAGETVLDATQYSYAPGDTVVYLDQGTRPAEGESVRVRYLPE